jgi:ubiquinone/menaquinone biosynthesis C-methylase UbiE
LGLTTTDRQTLDELLAGELDTAFRRRMLTVFELLGLADGDRLLDCGCGRGVALAYARELRPGSCRLGLDADLGELVAMGGAGDPSLRVCASAEALPFPDAAFDRLIASEVLEHVEDDRAMLAELHRVLAPGGIAAVTVPNARFPFAYDPVNAICGRLGRPVRRGPLAGIWTHHRRLYDAEMLRERAAAAGFEVGPVIPLTRACLPFQHLLLYGIGKPLVRGGWLPRSMTAGADRVSRPAGRRSPLDPVAALRDLIRRIDRANQRPGGDRSVNLAVGLRRPSDDGR